jgi:intracellular sulfur oxidation DsrE/DsrF family protein
MPLRKRHALLVAALLAATGCESVGNPFPSLSGPSPSTYAAGQPPQLGNTYFEPSGVSPGSPTGTYVGQKVQGFRGELSELQNAIRAQNEQLQTIRNKTIQDSQAYHENVAGMNARLQVGTTPGNPVLMNRWEQAQGQLNTINDDIILMNQLSAQITTSSAMANYLLDSVRAAFSLSGAVDEDHRQLRVLEDETQQTVVLIERLLNELSQDIARQQQYVGNEKQNLNALALAIKNGQLYGTSFANRPILGNPQMAAAGMPGMPGLMGGGMVPGGQPLVMVRFDRNSVDYETALYEAVNNALARYPNAGFQVVAVGPAVNAVGQPSQNTAQARLYAERVVRSLQSMGVDPNRIALSATTSPSAQYPEVHVLVQ